MITEPEKKREKPKVERARSGLYTENDMLFYTEPKTGLYAVLMNKKGYVSVPSGLEEIYSCAFQKCGKITGVYIPASIKKIGKATFGYNKKLEKIDVSPENTKYKTIDGVVFSKNGKRLIAYPAGKKNSVYRVPDGVEIIQDGAFMGAENLKKVILPDSVKYVGHKTFMDCVNLRAVQNNKKIKRFKITAFCNCKKIKVWPKKKYLV